MNPGATSDLTFAPDTLVDADSPSVTLTLALSDTAAGTVAIDSVAAVAAGLTVGADSSSPTLRGSPAAVSAFLEKTGAVSVSLGFGAEGVALELAASDGLETTRARLPLAATQPLAIKANYNGGALEILDLRGNDLRLNRFVLSNTTLGPLNDELTIQRLTATPLVVSASGGPDRYVFDAGSTEGEVTRTVQIRDTAARDLTNDTLVMRMKSLQFSTTGNVLQLGAGEVLSGVERVVWDQGLRELVVIGDVVTLKPLAGQTEVNLGQTRLRIEAERLVVEGRIQAKSVVLDVSGLVEMKGELLDESGGVVNPGAARVAKPVTLTAGHVDLGALVAGGSGAGLQVIPDDATTPIKLGSSTQPAARSVGGSLNLDPAGLAGVQLPVLVLGASGGSNPVALGGSGSVLALSTDLVVMAQGEGGRIEVGGQMTGQKLEIYGPGNTTVFAPGTSVAMKDSILIDDSVQFDGTVTVFAGEGAVTAEDLTITGRINGGLGTDDPTTSDFEGDTLALKSNGGVVQVAGPVGNGIGLLEVVSGGTGYVDGTYTNVDLIGGTGAGATATVEVSGGAVVSVMIHGSGAGYRSGDLIRIARSSLGDLSGKAQGFSARVTGVTALERLTVTGARDVIFDEKVVVDGDLVIQASGSVQFLDEVRITSGGRLIIEGAAELIINNGMEFEALSDKTAGGLEFDGQAAGSTVSFPAGIAAGDANRVTITGLVSLDMARGSQAPRFDLSARGSTIAMQAPIGQPRMVMELGRLDLESTSGDLTVTAASGVLVNTLKAGTGQLASLVAQSGSITLARDAVVSAGSVHLTALEGALQTNSGALVSAENLKVRVGQGVGSEAVPLFTRIDTLDVVTGNGDVFINDAGPLTLVGAGVTVGSGGGKVKLAAQGNLVMQPPATLSTAGGPVELKAAGDVGLSQITSKNGPIRIDSGGKIYDNTGGSGQTHLRTTSTLTLNAVSGVGGYGAAQIRLDASTVDLYNASGGDVVIVGETGIRAGSSGIRSDAPDGGLAVFSATGRVESGNIKAASGKLVMLSGKSGLTEQETAGVLAVISMGAGASASGDAGGAGSASPVFGGFGASTSAAPAPVSGGVGSALSSSAPSLSSSPGGLMTSATGGGAIAAGDGAGGASAGGLRGGDVVIAGRPVSAGESATSAVTSAATSGSGVATVPTGQGVVAISSTVSSAVQIGSITTIGRTTSLMLDAALKTIETSTRPTISGSGTLSELMNRTPAMRSEAPARLREGESAPLTAPAPTQPASTQPASTPAASTPAAGSSAAPAAGSSAAPAAAPTVAPGGVPPSAPASQAAPAAGASTPAAPAGEPVSPPPADSGATGAPAAPAAPPGPVPGSGGGAEGGSGAGQGATPVDGPRSLLPGPLLPTPVSAGLWARLARWLQPEAAASPAPVEQPDASHVDPAASAAEFKGGSPETAPTGVVTAQEGASTPDRASTSG